MADFRTRELILAYFATHPSTSAKELATELRLSSADIRYHLAILLRETVIELVPPPDAEVKRRGRPSRRLRLAVKQQPNNYQSLAAALLGILGEVTASSSGKLEETLAVHLADGQPLAKNMPRRTADAINFLNRQEYAAGWEARNLGPRIIFHNCPYAAIWPQFPALCVVDTHLLIRLFGVEVEQIETIQGNHPPHPACIFQVRNPHPRSASHPADS